MRCEAVRDALPALARGVLDGAEAVALRDHLGGCTPCATEFAIATALIGARERAPAGLAERVTGTTGQRHAHSPPRPIRWAATAGVALAATIALVLVWPSERAERAIENGARGAAGAPSTQGARADPFLDDDLFAGDARPIDADLDRVLSGVDLAPTVASMEGEAIPPLAMDLGSTLGDWPGADGISAGGMVLDDLTHEELQLLLSEMET